MAEIEVRVVSKGRKTPFADWLGSLRDARTIGIVRARLSRIRLGNFGDCKSVGGGVEELRIDFGSGYRVYFGREGALVVIVLCGGDKGAQRRDVLRAQSYWKEYLNAKTDN